MDINEKKLKLTLEYVLYELFKKYKDKISQEKIRIANEFLNFGKYKQCFETLDVNI